jgi:hypothetical protein
MGSKARDPGADASSVEAYFLPASVALYFAASRIYNAASEIEDCDMNAQTLQEATHAVDAAWQQLKRSPDDAAAQAAYDQAYQDWKRFGGGGRSVGRPASGDQSSLTSTERAQAARARQQQSAAHWEQVAPFVQQLRRAVKAGDDAGVFSIAKSLVKETEMVLSNVQVVHAQPDSDFVVLHGWHGREMMLAFISTDVLDDHFRRREHLSGQQANLVVDRNLEAFARIISAKYERGEHRPYSRFGSPLPRVDISLQDLESSGEEMTSSVLDLQAGFV